MARTRALLDVDALRGLRLPEVPPAPLVAPVTRGQAALFAALAIAGIVLLWIAVAR